MEIHVLLKFHKYILYPASFKFQRLCFLWISCKEINTNLKSGCWKASLSTAATACKKIFTIYDSPSPESARRPSRSSYCWSTVSVSRIHAQSGIPTDTRLPSLQDCNVHFPYNTEIRTHLKVLSVSFYRMLHGRNNNYIHRRTKPRSLPYFAF